MKYLDDVLLAGGCGCVVAGVHILAGFGWALVVGGVMLIGLAVMVGKVNNLTPGPFPEGKGRGSEVRDDLK